MVEERLMLVHHHEKSNLLNWILSSIDLCVKIKASRESVTILLIKVALIQAGNMSIHSTARKIEVEKTSPNDC